MSCQSEAAADLGADRADEAVGAVPAAAVAAGGALAVLVSDMGFLGLQASEQPAINTNANRR